MELISNPKAEYLLGRSLEELHAESREWLSEINFCAEEMSCYYKLLHKNVPYFDFPTKELAEIEKEMIRINSEDLINLKSRVESHERELATLMKNTLSSEEYEYRDYHRRLQNDIYAFRGMIKTFKEAIFALVRTS
jgi:hypothetical protein